MRILPALFILLMSATAAEAQAPARDTSAAAQKGTGVIRGRVVAGDSGRPLRRARVNLQGIGLGREGVRSTSTGPDGTYVVRDLPAARYRIDVTRSGFLKSNTDSAGRPSRGARSSSRTARLSTGSTSRFRG